MSRAGNTRISLPENEGEAVTGMAKGFAPVLFLIVIALIVMILGRMVKREQTLVGTFLAMGVGRRDIIRHYVKYALIPGVIGSLFGLLLAVPLTGVFARFYIDNDYERMEYQLSWDIPSVVIALVVPAILYCMAAAIVTGRLLRRPAVELLNHTGAQGKTVGIWKKRRTGISRKLRLRSVLGHPGRSAVTVAGVAIASVCLLVGFIMYDSLSNIIENGLQETVHYAYLYTLNYLGTGELPDGAQDGEALLRMYYEVEGSTQQLSVQGIEDGSSYYPAETLDGEPVDVTRYYLTNAASATYGVEKGDTMTFYSIADLTKHEVKIAGIVADDLHCYLYTSRENASGIAGFEDVSYNMIVSDKPLSIGEELLAGTTVMTEHGDTLSDLMGPIMAIVYIVVILGAVLCLFILYLVINMIIGEGRTTISVMKVLGFSGKEITGSILNVNHILVLCGYLLAIPGAYQFAKVGFSDSIEEYGMYFAPVVKAGSLLAGFVIIWLAYETSLLLQKRKLAKIDMVEVLKDNRRNE